MNDLLEKENTQVPCAPAEEKERAPISVLWLLPFFMVLAILCAVGYIPGLRPSTSEIEKRELKKFPEFSMEALFQGSYFDDISAWYSDTFPYRESWLSVSSQRSELYGISDVSVHGELSSGDDIPDAPPITPVPTAAPAVTPSPEPTWGGIDVDAENLETNHFGALLQVGDSVFEQFVFVQSGAERYAAMVSKAAEVCGERAKVYDILAPTGMGIMLPSDYIEEIGASDQQKAAEYMYACMSEKVTTVNAYPSMLEHNDEYLYFRTDHHWTALGAYYAYAEFCKTAGLEAAELEDFEALEYPGFLGSFYYSIGGNTAMKANPDSVVAYNPTGEIEMKITAKEGNTFPWPVINDMTHTGSSGLYLSFIGGDNPLTYMHNADIKDGSTCLLIKESFGNCFAPFLTQNYENVYVVDYRHYRAMTLSGFIDTYEVDDVIFLNAISMAEASGALGLMEYFVGQ